MMLRTELLPRMAVALKIDVISETHAQRDSRTRPHLDLNRVSLQCWGLAVEGLRGTSGLSRRVRYRRHAKRPAFANWIRSQDFSERHPHPLTFSLRQATSLRWPRYSGRAQPAETLHSS